EQAYVTYFNKGTVHSVPVIAAPFRVTLLTSPDSINLSSMFEVRPIAGGKVEISDTDTLFQVTWNTPFSLPHIGTLQLEQTGQGNLKEYYGFQITSVRDVVASLSSALTVEVTNKNVSTIDLTLENTLPKRGEQLLTTLIDKHVELNLHDKNVIADSTLAFINARLRTITDELAGVEDRISGYKRRNQLADISEQGKVLIESSADFTKRLAEIETQLAALDAVATYLKDTQHPRVVPSSVIPQDIGFNALIQQYNELVLQRERLLLANTQDNPLVQNITAQIAG